MVHRILAAACSPLLMMLAAGCASGARPVRVEPGRTPAVSRWSDLRLAPGTETIVRLMGGEEVRGAVRELRASELELLVRLPNGDAEVRTIAEPGIQTLARVVSMSTGARTRLGAVIGAAATLPFSISMFGDMIVPGAIVGGLIGHGTSNPRAEIVFERPAHSR